MATWCPSSIPLRNGFLLAVSPSTGEQNAALANRACATGPNPRYRAVVIPSGGPGDPGLDSITFFADTPMRDTHDIVTYDQRGAGRALPSLD